MENIPHLHSTTRINFLLTRKERVGRRKIIKQINKLLPSCLP